MTSDRGLVIIEANDTGTKGFYIDQDALECARLNARIKKRLANSEKKNHDAGRKRRKAEKLAAKRKRYNARMICYVLSRCAVSAAAAWAAFAGMVHPIICAAVVTFCLCMACLRLGEWFGRRAKK